MKPLFIFGLAAAAAVMALAAGPGLAAETRPGLKPCRLQGVEHEALCGVIQRPLDPAQPGGIQIDVHYAVLPALARNRKPDPVLFFAGGPGQSAMDLGGPVARMLTRLAYRRDVVLIDQRGTGRTAPLLCPELEPAEPMAESIDMARQDTRMQACLAQLKTLPHGDLRHYTTTVAMQDADAVRQALGAAQVNVVGGSYGTRAALEYLRQFPAAVRRTVIDGVAPPDMVMPAAMSTDAQAAIDAVLAACKAEAACAQRWPALAADWRSLLASLPREATVRHPLTGASEKLTITRDLVLGMVRAPLYAPVLASALPLAISEGARGRFEALVGLASSLGSRSTGRMSEGMHYSVVCAEDLPRLAQATDAPGADFGSGMATLYQRVCAQWPRGDVPAAFYQVPATASATLVLSGGADPVTPPRHGERVTKLLGAKARHMVVPQAGHGVMGLACMRDVLFRFIDADNDALALQVDASCAQGMPRPGAFVPPGLEVLP
ncbi:MAG: alpha/beta fold hydrolase [Rubrivivax sp.]|nr:alpha/beta fold hydrolase [Rubrivivax sp.]